MSATIIMKKQYDGGEQRHENSHRPSRCRVGQCRAYCRAPTSDGVCASSPLSDYSNDQIGATVSVIRPFASHFCLDRTDDAADRFTSSARDGRHYCAIDFATMK